MGAPLFDWAHADPGTLAEAFERAGASSTPPAVDWSEYAGLVAEQVAQWLAETARPLGRVFGPNVQGWLGWTVTGLAFVLAVVVAIRMIRVFNRRPPIVAFEGAGTRRRRVPMLTGEQHRLNALASLEREEARLALTSIWWWFAAAALKEQPEPTLTTRDVIRRSGREDLRGRAQKLDRLRFSAIAPTTTEVRELLRDFEAAF